MNRSFPLLALLLLLLPLTSCDLAGDIFELGAYVGIIGVVLVALLLYWLYRRIRR